MNSNWSYSPETKIWVVTSVTLTFDLWPWPFAWTLPWSNVITPENFMMIRWWEHSQKGVTDGQTDRRTDRHTDRRTDGQTDGQTDRRTENTIHRAAWSQLKMTGTHHFPYISETPRYMKGAAINTWESHWAKRCHGEIMIDSVRKAMELVDILAFLIHRLDRNTLEIIHKTFIRPILEYGDVLFCNMTKEHLQMTEQVNKRTGSIISGAIRGTSSNVIYNEMGWVTM